MPRDANAFEDFIHCTTACVRERKLNLCFDHLRLDLRSRGGAWRSSMHLSVCYLCLVIGNHCQHVAIKAHLNLFHGTTAEYSLGVSPHHRRECEHHPGIDATLQICAQVIKYRKQRERKSCAGELVLQSIL